MPNDIEVECYDTTACCGDCDECSLWAEAVYGQEDVKTEKKKGGGENHDN